MKYTAETYAKAFLEALVRAGEQGEKRVAKNFAALIKKNGDLANYGMISLEIEKLLAKREGGKFISVEVARDGNAIGKITNLFSKKDVVKIRTTSELLAGVRVLIDNEQELDFSFRRRLKTLFS